MSSGQRQTKGTLGIKSTQITDGSRVVMQEMLDCVNSGQRHSRKAKFKGDYQVRIRSVVLVVV